jgi:uncharacterized protein
VAAAHEFITMSDGARLSADLYFPQGDGPWPALLEALPYRKDDITLSYRPEYARLAENGYVMCRVDVRGTGSSEGLATDEYPEQEQRDLCDVIDWLATREWSSGSVGMYGTSYSGFNSIQVAMQRPPALKAIIPIFATDDRYADDVHYMGGVLKQLDLIDYPTYMTAMNALPPVPALAGPDWRTWWERRVRENEPWVIAWLEHQRFGPYWQHGSLRPTYDAIEAATMIVAGWADGYRNNSLRTMAELHCPKRLVLGPWAHAAVDSSNPGPNIDLVAEHLRWWDRWLKGIDNGVDTEPEIVVFVRHATVPEPDLPQQRGQWRFEPTWPAERLRPTAYELADAAGPPRSEAAATDRLDVRADVGWTAWISCAGVLPWGQPDDQRADEAFSLSYDWGPLTEPLEVMGYPRFDAVVTSSEPVAYLSAKLCDVFEDGTSSLVTRGVLNLTHRGSREDPSPLQPGADVHVSFDLEACAYVFDPGHRIRLDIAGTDWPNVAPPPGPVTLRLDRERSTLTMPVLDGPSPTPQRPALAPAGGGKDASPPAVPDASQGRSADLGEGIDSALTWRIEHDQLERRTRAFASSWDDVTFEDGRARRMKEIYGGVVWVSTTDPGTSAAESRARFEIEWPEATCVSEVRQTVVNDRASYHVRIELKTSEDGEPRWSRTWERTIPRDLQ